MHNKIIMPTIGSDKCK